MWNIWKEELCKIMSRKIIWLGVFLLLAFVSFRLSAERNDYTTAIDGRIYHGSEAIRKDQELTAHYAGTLTEELVAKVCEDFGFYYYDKETKYVHGNFCSRFVTETFTNYMQTEGNDPDAVSLYTGGDWELYAAPYFRQPVKFDYIYGWDDFAEMYVTALLALFVILTVGISPLFSEEYQLRTADLLRTTRRGKQSVVWLKFLAAICFAAALTCAVSVYLWGIYAVVYGTQGLDASALLLNFSSFYGYCPETVMGFLLFTAFLGLCGAILLTGLTAGISSLCRSPFPALILSLAVFLFPVVWMSILGPMGIFGASITKAVTHFMTSMPFYLPQSIGFAFSTKQLGMHLCIASAAGTCSILAGYHKFRNM